MKKGVVKMKNKIFVILTVCLMLLASLGIHAESGNGLSWFCTHRKDHRQPICDPSLSIISQYDGYYIDRSHGDDCNEKVIYLTFDAGYENGNVKKILDVLKEEEVTGAFFILGNLIKTNPELVTRMFEEGHLVCNHTFRHDPMIGKSQAEISKELSSLEELCLSHTGYQMAKYYRPPEGRFDESTLRAVSDLGYKSIFWSFAYADWDNGKQPSYESAKKKILENVHNGEIMLLHPTSTTNASILGEVIRELRAEGYRFGTLDELCLQ